MLEELELFLLMTASGRGAAAARSAPSALATPEHSFLHGNVSFPHFRRDWKAATSITCSLCHNHQKQSSHWRTRLGLQENQAWMWQISGRGGGWGKRNALEVVFALSVMARRGARGKNIIPLPPCHLDLMKATKESSGMECMNKKKGLSLLLKKVPSTLSSLSLATIITSNTVERATSRASGLNATT